MEYILGHKIYLNSLNTEIVQSMFSHHNGITLENKNRNIFRKSPQYLEIKKHTSK